MTPLPPPTLCEAATALGGRCRGYACATVDLGDRGRRRLCGSHLRRARRGGVALWRPGLDPPPKRRYTRGGVWTAEEDAYLVARPDVPLAELAAHLGRTVEAVRNRRYVLRQQPAQG